MNELAIINTNSIVNKSLEKDLAKINTELIKRDKTNFKLAETIAHIFDSKNYTDDFQSEKEIAEFLGISIAQVSTFRTVTFFKKTINSTDWIIDEVVRQLYNSFPVSKLAELRPFNKLISEETSIFTVLERFYNWNIDKYGNFGTLNITQKELRERVKNFIHYCHGEDADTDTDTVTDTNTNTDTDNDTDTFITIRIGKDIHNIPENDNFVKDLTKLMSKYDFI